MKKQLLFIAGLFIVFGSAQAQDKTASVTFDGIDDYIHVEHDDALNLGTSSFTIEAVISVNPNLASTSAIVVSKKGLTGSSQDGYLFGLNGSGKTVIQLEGDLYSGGFGKPSDPGVSAKDLRDGSCHHIAWVRDVSGSNDRITGYQDGQMIKKSSRDIPSYDITNMEDLWIGWSEDFNTANLYQFMGDIKEVRIWKVARTQAEIDANKYVHLTGNEPGLAAYWRLNESGTGLTAFDCSPNNNKGLLTNGATWKTFTCDVMTNAAPAKCGDGIPLGVNESLSQTELEIYPNPSQDIIQLRNESSLVVDMVRMYDLNGKVVLTKNWNGMSPLNISELQTGMYLIQLSNNETILHQSMVSKR